MNSEHVVIILLYYHCVPQCTPHSTSQNNSSISSAIFAQQMPHCPYTLHCASPINLPLALGDLNLHLIHGSFGPRNPLYQTESQSSRLFFQNSQSLPLDTVTGRRNTELGLLEQLLMLLQSNVAYQ